MGFFEIFIVSILEISKKKIGYKANARIVVEFYIFLKVIRYNERESYIIIHMNNRSKLWKYGSWLRITGWTTKTYMCHFARRMCLVSWCRTHCEGRPLRPLLQLGHEPPPRYKANPIWSDIQHEFPEVTYMQQTFPVSDMHLILAQQYSRSIDVRLCLRVVSFPISIPCGAHFTNMD